MVPSSLQEEELLCSPLLALGCFLTDPLEASYFNLKLLWVTTEICETKNSIISFGI